MLKKFIVLFFKYDDVMKYRIFLYSVLPYLDSPLEGSGAVTKKRAGHLLDSSPVDLHIAGYLTLCLQPIS